MAEISPNPSGEDSVRRTLAALAKGWPAIVLSAVVVGGFALIYSLLQTPEYSATSSLYVTSGTDDASSTAYQGSLASQQRVTSYTKLISSDAVVQQALRDSKLNLSLDEAKADLTAAATPDTVLLSISAKNPDKTTAAELANAVASSMASYVARLETPTGGGQPLAKLTVVSAASVSNAPVSPKTERNVALGAFVGLLFGLLVVFIRLRLNNRIGSESDVALVTDVPVVGNVPKDERLTGQGLVNFREGATAAAEAFRKLRTNLTFTNVDKPAKVILVTSAVAVEGKTTTAMNLAAALVEADHRVVIVDADLRRPQVDARSGLVGDVGLTNFLRGDGDLNDLVQPTQVDGLWILASGTRPPNPAELLGTKRSGQALAELSSSFDYVIVDSPPVLPVTDAVVLAQWVDGILLVARSGSTRIPDLRDAFAQISAVQTPVTGVVLTETRGDKARYGYYAVGAGRKSILGRSREPKAIESVLEPTYTSKH